MTEKEAHNHALAERYRAEVHAERAEQAVTDNEITEEMERVKKERDEALDFLRLAAPKLSYAPPKWVRKGHAPPPKERWLRDEIEDFLTALETQQEEK